MYNPIAINKRPAILRIKLSAKFPALVILRLMIEQNKGVMHPVAAELLGVANCLVSEVSDELQAIRMC